MCAGVVLAGAAVAQVVPGYTVQSYASVTDPIELTFAPDGTLFAGRDNFFSGGGPGDPLRIHRIGYGGGSVTEYGAAVLPDPDAVLYDGLGTLAPAGSVLVAGDADTGPGNLGALWAIPPDESITQLIAPTAVMHNPNTLAFDINNRLLIGDDDGTGRIFEVVAGVPQLLVSLPAVGSALAVEQGTNNIYTRQSDGFIRIYNQAGMLLNPAFVGGLGNVADIAFGPGGSLWGTDLYAVNQGTGQLLRIDSLGAVNVIGTGFSSLTTGMTFGPDGYMYLSVTDADTVIRIIPEPGALLLLVLGAFALRRR